MSMLLLGFKWCLPRDRSETWSPRTNSHSVRVGSGPALYARASHDPFKIGEPFPYISRLTLYVPCMRGGCFKGLADVKQRSAKRLEIADDSLARQCCHLFFLVHRTLCLCVHGLASIPAQTFRDFCLLLLDPKDSGLLPKIYSFKVQ